jgi:hypothetical protein
MKLLAVGPNGGEVYLLAVKYSDTIGNTRQLFAYPTGGVTAKSAILHHAQLEEADHYSSPIYGKSGPTTRNADEIYVEIPLEAAAHTFYAKLFDLTESELAYVMHYGSTSIAVDPRLAIWKNSGTNKYVFTHDNGTTVTQAVMGGSGVSPRSVVEQLANLNADGSVDLEQSIDGGATTTASDTDPATIKQWAGERFYLNGASASGVGAVGLIALIACRGSYSLREMRRLLP